MARLRMFASVREAAGRGSDEIEAATVGELLDRATQKYGSAFQALLPSVSVALNGSRIGAGTEGTPISAGDEVALLPPVSGGSRAGAARGAPTPRRSGLPFLLALALGIMALFLSFLGKAFFTAFVAVVLAFGAVELARMLGRGSLKPPPLASGIAAGVFPLAAALWGELGLLRAAAAVILGLAGTAVLKGLRPNATANVASSFFVSLYLGFLGAYAVLIRTGGRGAKLLASLGLMTAGYHVARWAAERFGVRRGLVRSGAGVAACLAGLAGARFALSLPVRPGPMVVLGVVVGLALAAGNSAGALLRADLGAAGREATLPGWGGLLLQLDALLLAAPACYYGFRIYLT